MKKYHIILITPTGNMTDIVIANQISISNAYIRFINVKGAEVAVYPTKVTVIKKIEN